MLGLIQEQHPDRCRLFMQWKEMDWPIVVDSYDLLEVEVVPITLAIDEHGVIRHRGLRLRDADNIAETFLHRSYPAPETAQDQADVAPSDPVAPARPGDGAAANDWRAYADWQATWSQWSGAAAQADLGSAISAYTRALDLDPADAWSSFRRGVAYRQRYDSQGRTAGDFQRAVDDWTRALELDPNNYIWRRRIQQYGPRLDKPYPFYDWVERARSEIRARGQQPYALAVEPEGSEIAEPLSGLTAATAPAVSAPEAGTSGADPEGRIRRDEGPLIELEATVVPRRLEPGQASRIHLVMTPRAELAAHWNNEVDELVVWLEEEAGIELGGRRLTTPNPPTAVSTEVRRVETELRIPEDAEPGPASVRGYALYYVCEDIDGVCLYRRQDFEARLSVEK